MSRLFKRIGLICFVILMVCGTAYGGMFYNVVKIEDLQDYVVMSESGDFKANNFNIREGRAFLVDNFNTMNVEFAAQNRSDSPIHFTAMIMSIPKDYEKYTILGFNLSPMMTTLTEKSTEVISTSSYVWKGSINGIKNVIIVINGDFK